MASSLAAANTSLDARVAQLSAQVANVSAGVAAASTSMAALRGRAAVTTLVTYQAVFTVDKGDAIRNAAGPTAPSARSWVSIAPQVAGVQLWSAPATGAYTFTLAGAAGGTVRSEFADVMVGGAGRVGTVTTELAAGDTLALVIGQMGEPNGPGGAAGGGGGTFVFKYITGELLFAAAGGGGAPGAQASDGVYYAANWVAENAANDNAPAGAPIGTPGASGGGSTATAGGTNAPGGAGGNNPSGVLECNGGGGAGYNSAAKFLVGGVPAGLQLVNFSGGPAPVAPINMPPAGRIGQYTTVYQYATGGFGGGGGGGSAAMVTQVSYNYWNSYGSGSDYRCGGGGGGGAIGGTGGRSAYIAWSGSMGSPITITRFGNATGGGGGYGVNITNYTGYNNGDGYVIIAPLAGPTGVYTA